MKKFIIALVALSVTGLSYAGEGCTGGGCSADKKAKTESAEKKADKTTEAAKS